MKPRQVGHFTLFAGLALLLGACTATPITLPMADLGAGFMDAGMAYDYGGLDLGPVGKADGPGQPFPDSGNAMDAFGGDGEAGITEAGITEGGITEGGITEGGVAEGGITEGGVADLASD